MQHQENNQIQRGLGLSEQIISALDLPFQTPNGAFRFAEEPSFVLITQSARWPLLLLRDHVLGHQSIKDLLSYFSLYFVESKEYELEAQWIIKNFENQYHFSPPIILATFYKTSSGDEVLNLTSPYLFKNSNGLAEITKLLEATHSKQNPKNDYIKHLKNDDIIDIENFRLSKDHLELKDKVPSAKLLADHILQGYKIDQDPQHIVTHPHFNALTYLAQHMRETVIDQQHQVKLFQLIDHILFSALHDHLRGGMYIFSSDSHFKAPIFEKHLIGQAYFLDFLTMVTLVYKAPHTLEAKLKLLNALENEFLRQDGVFLTSQQDYNLEEIGAYPLFTPAEIKECLTNKELIKFFDLSSGDYFSSSHDDNHENDHSPLAIQLKRELKDEIFQKENWEALRESLMKMLEKRKERIPTLSDMKAHPGENFAILRSLTRCVKFAQYDVIQRQAKSLVEKSYKTIFKAFTKQTESDFFILKNPFGERVSHNLDDYLQLAHLQIELYQNNKETYLMENAVTLTKMILTDFITDDLTIKASRSNDIHAGLRVYDDQLPSTLGELNHLLRRMAFYDEYIKDFYLKNGDIFHTNLMDSLFQLPPQINGSTLNTLSYPQESLGLFKVPKSWSVSAVFNKMSPRFEWFYHSLPEEKWQLEHYEKVLISGEGLESFKKEVLGESESDENQNESSTSKLDGQNNNMSGNHTKH